MFLVDTNVLLDLATDDPRWADWSQRTLETAALAGRLLVNPIIYAEFSIGFSRIEAVDAVLKTIGIAPVEIPDVQHLSMIPSPPRSSPSQR